MALDLMEVVGWLRGHGFDLVKLEEAFRHPQTGQLLQCDGLFVRRLRRSGNYVARATKRGLRIGRAIVRARRRAGR